MKKLKFILATSILLSSIGSSLSMTFDEAYNLSLKNDPTFLKAKAVLRSNNADFLSSWSQVLPKISLDYTYNYSRFAITSDIYSYSRQNTLSLNLSQPIFNARLFGNLSVANKKKVQDSIVFAQARQDLFNRLMTSYIDVLTNYKEIASLKSQREAIKNTNKSAKSKYDQKIISKTDLLSTEAELERIKAQILVAQVKFETSISDLANMTGVKEISTLQDINDKLPLEKILSAFPYKEVTLDHVLNNNLNIKNLILAKELADTGVKIAYMSFAPTISLGVRLNNGQGSPEVIFTKDSRFKDFHLKNTQISLNFSLPIFLGGSDINNIRKVSAYADEINQAYKLAQQSVRKGYYSLYTSLESTQAIIKALKISSKNLHDVYKNAQATYDVGLTSIQTVLDANKGLYAIQNNLDSSIYNYVKSIISFNTLNNTLNDNLVNGINEVFTKEINLSKEE